MTPEQIIEMAKQAGFGISKYTHMTFDSVHLDELQAFAQLVRNAALDEAKEICRQTVRETNTTLTWEGCSEIQQAIEKEKS